MAKKIQAKASKAIAKGKTAAKGGKAVAAKKGGKAVATKKGGKAVATKKGGKAVASKKGGAGAKGSGSKNPAFAKLKAQASAHGAALGLNSAYTG